LVALAEFRTILSNAGAGAVSAEVAEGLIRQVNEAPPAIQHGLSGEVWAHIVGSSTAHQYATEAALTVAMAHAGSVDRDMNNSKVRGVACRHRLQPKPL